MARGHPTLSRTRATFYEPFEVDARRYMRRYGVDATPLDVAITRTIDWYRSSMRIAA